MFKKGSRYENAVPFTGEFKGVRPRKIGRATGILEHIVKEGDRPDLLAGHYYNDPGKWWRIADANPDLLYSGSITLDTLVGHTILIPGVREQQV